MVLPCKLAVKIVMFPDRNVFQFLRGKIIAKLSLVQKMMNLFTAFLCNNIN